MKLASVEEYILNSRQWQVTLNMLREVLLALDLEETLKWNIPVYCIDGQNVVGLAAFKNHCALWFYQGVFLKDEKKKLYCSHEETRAQRQWQFFSEDQVENELEDLILYINESIENAKLGKKISPVKNKPYTIPEELKRAFVMDPNLKHCFDLLSHSKKREFSRYIGEAKMPVTKQKRLDQSIPLIKEGKSLMDKYRKK